MSLENKFKNFRKGLNENVAEIPIIGEYLTKDVKKVGKDLVISGLSLALISYTTGCATKLGTSFDYTKNYNVSKTINNSLKAQAINLNRVDKGVKKLDKLISEGKVLFDSKEDLLKNLAKKGVKIEKIDQALTYTKVFVSGAIDGVIIYYSLKGYGGGSSSSGGGGSSPSTYKQGIGTATGSVTGGNAFYVPR